MRKEFRKGYEIMQELKKSVMEIEVNDCSVTLYFASKSMEEVIENLQSILSSAYDERIQKELKKLIGERVSGADGFEDDTL